MEGLAAARRISSWVKPLRIGYVDGLRAIAVLGVVFYHAHASAALGLSLGAPLHLPTYWWDPVFFAGRHGVDLFFVISGFCLSLPILRAHAAGVMPEFDVARFWGKRAVRILPPYWVAALFFIAFTAVLVALGIALPPTIVATHWPDLLGQFVFLDHNVSFSNGSFWTLAVEARWYLIFPLVIWLWICHRRCFWVAMAACVLLYHATRITPIDVATLPAFMLGVVAAELRVREAPVARYALAILPLVLLWAFLTDRMTLQDAPSWQVASFCFVVAAGAWAPLQRALSWAPLTFVGLCSYSIYLYHEPIEQLLVAQVGWAWPMTAAAALAVGVLAWLVVERQVLLPGFREPWNERASNLIRRAVAWMLTGSGDRLALRLPTPDKIAIPVTSRSAPVPAEIRNRGLPVPSLE